MESGDLGMAATEIDDPKRMARQLVLLAATAPVVRVTMSDATAIRVAGMLNADRPAASAEAAPFDWVDVGMRGLVTLQSGLAALKVALITAVMFGVFG